MMDAPKEAVDEAARWLALPPDARINQPLIPLLCAKFGLSRDRAEAAAREAAMRHARAA